MRLDTSREGGRGVNEHLGHGHNDWNMGWEEGGGQEVSDSR